MAFTFTVVTGTDAALAGDGDLITTQSQGNFVQEPAEMDTLSGTFWVWGLKIGQVQQNTQVSPTGAGLADFGTDYTATITPAANVQALKTGAQLSTSLQNMGGGIVPVLAGSITHTLFGG